MPPDEFVVPALPVLLPLGGILMAFSWAMLRRRGELTGRRLAAAWLCVGYAVAVVGATLLPLRVSVAGGPIEWIRINPIPVHNFQPGDFTLNVLMTMPVAVVAAVLFGIRDRARVLRAGLLLSVAIETTQCLLILTVHGNRWAELNDVVANVLGTYVGALLFEWLMRFAAVRRAVYRLEPSRE